MYVIARLPAPILLVLFMVGCASQDGAPVDTGAVSAPPPALEVTSDAYIVECDGQLKGVDEVLAPIVDNMVSQKIPYTQNPADEWRDCSGNFLRLSSYVAGACGEQASNLAAPAGITDYLAGGTNVAPGGEKARSSRDIARWYYSQGRFTPIYYDGVTRPSQIPDDLKNSRNLIRPGAVVWFSFSRPKSSEGVDGLFNRRVSRGPHINHMGTVTKVHLDSDGDVSSFEMYHGRSRKNPAGVTRSHYWRWPDKYLAGGSKEYPSFGYWNQYLVGVGTLLPAQSALAAN